VFLAVSAAALLSLLWFRGGNRELTQRLEALRDPKSAAARGRAALSRREAQNTVQTYLARLGSRLLPDTDAARARLMERFMHAGIYHPAGPSIFTSVRFVAGIVTPLLVLLAGRVGLIGNNLSLYIAGALGLAGVVGSNLWLQSRIVKRRRELRRSLPDFLDLMGACMQAGQSFEAALARVTDELRAAHQALAFELLIVQREMMLGATALRALRGFAERSGLDVVRQLSTLVDQSQRFGSSMTESLRVHAEMLRMQRTQQAETKAHKAGVKILLPTLLFIFPPVLVILAGPAVIDLHEMLVRHSASSTAKR
jgi:tight adherence protein C